MTLSDIQGRRDATVTSIGALSFTGFQVHAFF